MKRALSVTLGLVCLLAAAACASSPTAAVESTLLPQSVALELATVRTHFPQVTRLAKTGRDGTAQGNPSATRSVFYENGGGSKRVTISVDRYANAADAASAYATALAKSKIPGFKPLHVPKLGDETFAGTVTMKGETHVGLGVLLGNLVVGATLAGFPASAGTISQFVAMSRAQVAHVQKGNAGAGG